jgi:hypothetical protein
MSAEVFDMGWALEAGGSAGTLHSLSGWDLPKGFALQRYEQAVVKRPELRESLAGVSRVIGSGMDGYKKDGQIWNDAPIEAQIAGRPGPNGPPSENLEEALRRIRYLRLKDLWQVVDDLDEPVNNGGLWVRLDLSTPPESRPHANRNRHDILIAKVAKLIGFHTIETQTGEPDPTPILEGKEGQIGLYKDPAELYVVKAKGTKEE